MSDVKLMLIIVLGAVCIGVGGWNLILKVTLGLIIKKIAGLVLAGIGLFLITGFPTTSDYQPHDMSRAGVLIGLILFILGVWWLLF